MLYHILKAGAYGRRSMCFCNFGICNFGLLPNLLHGTYTATVHSPHSYGTVLTQLPYRPSTATVPTLHSYHTVPPQLPYHLSTANVPSLQS